VVIALGGNALLKRGQDDTDKNQIANARVAAESIAKVVNAGYRVVVTHGNGPQVGHLAVLSPNTGLDVLDAETEGQIGYIIQMELFNALQRVWSHEKRRPIPAVVSLITETVVDANDPAFQHPTKPIGALLHWEQAEAVRNEGFQVAKDGNDYRRVVASPLPKKIVQQSVIRSLVQHDVILVCCGGGGVPVVEQVDGDAVQYHGIAAVVDKDEASSFLASELNADALLLLTDAKGVIPVEEWNKSRNSQPPSDDSIVRELHVERVNLADYASGSMRPKLSAAVRFVKHGPERPRINDGAPFAAIGNLEDALDILKGKTGTRIVRE